MGKPTVRVKCVWCVLLCMSLQRGADELHNEIKEAIIGEGGVDPVKATTVEDQRVVYNLNSIKGNRLPSGGVDVTFYVSLAGDEVSALTEMGGRKILKANDGINTTITFGEQLWYVLMGEYSFKYTTTVGESFQMDGKIRVFDAERVE